MWWSQGKVGNPTSLLLCKHGCTKKTTIGFFSSLVEQWKFLSDFLFHRWHSALCNAIHSTKLGNLSTVLDRCYLMPSSIICLRFLSLVTCCQMADLPLHILQSCHWGENAYAERWRALAMYWASRQPNNYLSTLNAYLLSSLFGDQKSTKDSPTTLIAGRVWSRDITQLVDCQSFYTIIKRRHHAEAEWRWR